jgi:deazaflavin-dependent oxidoreductase (nitroreductase family)
MVLPKSLARFNRVVTNRIGTRFSGRAPGFAKVIHRGRKSGREYRTPVMVFHHDGGYVVALTYGPDTDWVRNVAAAGECTLETRGHTVKVTNPRVVHDPERGALPVVVRQVTALIGVRDLLYLDAAS